MKKLLAFTLAVLVLTSVFSFVTNAQEEPLEFYAGVKEGTDAPKMDGKIEDGEYAVAIEDLNPNDPECEYYKYLVYSNLSGGDKEPSGKSDTISYSIYLSVDDQYLYAAAIEKDLPYVTQTGGEAEDNKAITVIDFTLPSGAAFRFRLVFDGEISSYCENMEENKISPSIADYGFTNVIEGDYRYIAVELRVKLDDIGELIGEDVPNEIYFAAFNRFDNYDDVVFQALDKDAPTGEFAGYVGCTLLRRCHVLHLNEKGKCAHRGMEKEIIDESTHKLTCECGHVEVAEHEWSGIGEVIVKATYTEEGLKRYTCKQCQTTKDEVIPKRPPRSDMQTDDAQNDGPSDDTEKQGGCGASVSLTSIVLVAVVGIGVAACEKKKLTNG